MNACDTAPCSLPAVQECVLEKAIADKKAPGVVARLAKQVRRGERSGAGAQPRAVLLRWRNSLPVPHMPGPEVTKGTAPCLVV